MITVSRFVSVLSAYGCSFKIVSLYQVYITAVIKDLFFCVGCV